MKLPRQDVYDLIDGERDYQDALGPGRTDGQQKSVGDYLVLLDRYVHEAKASYVGVPGNLLALDVVRKVAGIAVRCMEEHGAPQRHAT
jgi:hypothetical protein